jgi:hypothetical protein
MLHTWIIFRNFSDSIPALNRRCNGFPYDRSSMPFWLAAVLCLSLFSGQAWGEIGIEEKGAIVAAGFGYQIGSVATIAVKMYDAGSGDILSDESYELTVMESEGAGSSHGPRIFAGGVGLGDTDLSNFVLRVYDANTGMFQWEGRLNLVQPAGKGEGHVVSTAMPRRATLTKRCVGETAREQPVFLLRALDAVTGLLVWQDEFTTAHTRIPRAQQIAAKSIQLDRVPTGAPHAFDFRIRMYDPSGQSVLWEDQLSRSEPEEGTQESSSDQAYLLPAWPSRLQEESGSESI